MSYRKKRECVAMLLAGGVGSRLYRLTDKIAKPAVSFGGKYKIIDFTLSNCTNSGIDTVGILTQYRPLVLNEYIGNGQSWKLDSSDGGVVMLPPYQAKSGADWYKGTANAIYQNIEFIDRYMPDYVLILSGDHIYRMDYDKMLEQHKASDVDCTVATIKVPYSEASRFGILSSDERGRITDFEEKPTVPKSNNASMGIYIFNTEILKKYLTDDANDKSSSHDFGKNIIPKMLENGEKLYSYSFEGYWKDVGTLDSYLESHMDLLGKPPQFDIWDENFPIYTKDRALPPHFVGENAEIQNSIIGAGCEIEGKVKNSVIFENADIGKDAEIYGSVVLEDAGITLKSKIEKSIVDVDFSGEKKKNNSQKIARNARRDVCGIIFSNLHDKNVPELTRCRTMAAIPFAARYRLVDFPLSSMVHSGIKNIKIIAHHNYNSLMEHIGSGRDFGLSVDFGGIKILPPYIRAFLNQENGLYGSRLEALIGIKDVIERTKEKYIVLSDCDVVGNVDLNDIIDHHIKKGADMTIAVKKISKYDFVRDTVIIDSDKNNRICDVRREDMHLNSESEENLNIWVANTEYLKLILRDALAHGYRSFTRDVLRRNLSRDKFVIYRCDEPIVKISSLREYFNVHMSLLSDENFRHSLFGKEGMPVFSKTSSISPTKYQDSAKVKNSLVAEGCVIEGEIENCVVFEGVYIGKGAKVKNSVLLPYTSVDDFSNLNCVVTEKNSKIEKESQLFGCFELPFYVQGELVYR